MGFLRATRSEAPAGDEQGHHLEEELLRCLLRLNLVRGPTKNSVHGFIRIIQGIEGNKN